MLSCLMLYSLLKRFEAIYGDFFKAAIPPTKGPFINYVGGGGGLQIFEGKWGRLQENYKLKRGGSYKLYTHNV